MAGKYYWLKLKEDFFESNDIQVVESMPSGKDFIIFYLKLLCKSIRYEGNLRLTEEIPYNEETLAAITHTDVNVVKQAVQIFSGLHLIEVLDDGTYYMNKVQDMLGSETKWAEKKRIYREKQQMLEGQTEDNVLTMSDKSIDIRDKSIEYRDKSIDIRDKDKRDKDNNKTAKRFTPPTLDDVKAYCKSRNNNIDAEAFIDYYAARGWVLSKGQKMKDWEAAVRTWERRDNEKKPKKVEDDFDWGDVWK